MCIFFPLQMNQTQYNIEMGRESMWKFHTIFDQFSRWPNSFLVFFLLFGFTHFDGGGTSIGNFQRKEKQNSHFFFNSLSLC